MKTKVHTVYKNKDGKRIPSVTTVLNILNKPALLSWAWQCGCDGLDYRKVRDDAADVGTLAHYLILCHLKNESPDLTEYAPDVIQRAENALIQYWDWEKENPVTPLLIEEPLISEMYQYGGTIDCLAQLNGELILIDHKTSKAIYKEMFYQLAAYRQLLKENGYNISNARILRISKEDNGDFEQRIMNDLDKHFDIFLSCLNIYNKEKEI
jgi:hypothetical protein